MRKKIERKIVTKRIVRTLEKKKEIRFVLMETTNMKKAFTRKHKLPKINHVHKSHKFNLISQIKELGYLGSDTIMRLFPEFDKTTIGQLIRYYG